jgi:hypothetical protein
MGNVRNFPRHGKAKAIGPEAVKTRFPNFPTWEKREMGETKYARLLRDPQNARLLRG